MGASGSNYRMSGIRGNDSILINTPNVTVYKLNESGLKNSGLAQQKISSGIRNSGLEIELRPS
jgi:hypothetical protein